MNLTTHPSSPEELGDNPTVAEPTRSIGLHRGQVLRALIAAAVVLALGYSVPYIVLDRFYIAVLFDGLVLSILALSIAFLARHLGLISLGHVAFFGGSAYAVGIGMTRFDMPPVVAATFAVITGTLLAAGMGFLVVRATGMGFLMLTLALGQALYMASIQSWAHPWTGAYDGLQFSFGSDQTFLGMDHSTVMNGALFWPVVWTGLVLCSLMLWLVGRSRFGVVLEGIRENEERMRFSGFNTFIPRLVAFTLSGAVASLAGVFFALNAAYVSPEVLGFLKAGDSLIAAIVGGLGTLVGPIIGGFLYTIAQARFSTGGNLHLYTGMALILVLMFIPGGISGGIQDIWRRVRAKIRKDGSE